MIEFGNTLADAGRKFLENYDPFSGSTDMRSWESYRAECHQLQRLVSDLRQHIAELTKQMADAAIAKAEGRDE